MQMAADMEASMFSMFSMFNMHVRVCVHACACVYGTSPTFIPTSTLSTHLPPPQGGGPPESLKIQ